MRKIKNNYVPAEYGGYLFPKSCLPDILPGDRGKVLTVNQNETEAIWAPAAGALFVNINVTYDEDEEEIVSAILDKTWAEINGALRSGTAVFFASVSAGFINGYTLAGVYSGSVALVDSNGHSYDFFANSENDYPEYRPGPS